MKDSVVVCIFALKKYIEHKHCQENIHYVMEKWALKNKMNEKKRLFIQLVFLFTRTRIVWIMMGIVIWVHCTRWTKNKACRLLLSLFSVVPILLWELIFYESFYFISNQMWWFILLKMSLCCILVSTHISCQHFFFNSKEKGNVHIHSVLREEKKAELNSLEMNRLHVIFTKWRGKFNNDYHRIVVIGFLVR